MGFILNFDSRHFWECKLITLFAPHLTIQRGTTNVNSLLFICHWKMWLLFLVARFEMTCVFNLSFVDKSAYHLNYCRLASSEQLKCYLTHQLKVTVYHVSNK